METKLAEIDITDWTRSEIHENQNRWLAKYEQHNGYLEFELIECADGHELMVVSLINN